MVKIPFDLRLIEIEAELRGLNEYLTALEEQLEFLADQRKVQMRAQLIEEGLIEDEVEVDIAHQELRLLVEHIYPRSFRGTFVVSLWAVYEAGVGEIAEFVRKERQLALRLSDIRGGTFTERVKKYFDHVIHFTLHVDPAAPGQLAELYHLRNAFAHANGRFRSLSPSTRNAMRRVVDEERGLTSDIFDSIVIEKDYLRRMYEIVRAELQTLVTRARALEAND